MAWKAPLHGWAWLAILGASAAASAAVVADHARYALLGSAFFVAAAAAMHRLLVGDLARTTPPAVWASRLGRTVNRIAIPWGLLFFPFLTTVFVAIALRDAAAGTGLASAFGWTAGGMLAAATALLAASSWRSWRARPAWFRQRR